MLFRSTAMAQDSEITGREIYANLMNGDYGPIVSYEDSHWYSLVDNNLWNNMVHSFGDLMLSPTGSQPPNSTNKPVPPAPSGQ